MGRKFIATILAAAMAVTSLTAPARAGNDDIVKFLAGATALIIIGKTIENNRAKASESRNYNPNRYHNGYNHDGSPRYGNTPRRHAHDADQPRRVTPPRDCKVNVQTRKGEYSGYGYRCVQRYPRIARALPESCIRATMANRGPRHVYATPCLRRAGFRV